MAYTQAKYTIEKTQEITMRALGVLSDSKEPLTIDEICRADLALCYQTNQKMARCLNELIEAGFVRKTKSKAKGKMIYMAVANLEDQGYDMDNFVC